MQFSMIARAAVASLYICQTLAAPQGRGPTDDTRTLSLPSPEEMASALGLKPRSASTITSPVQPTPTSINSSTPNASKKKAKVSGRDEGNCKAIVYDFPNEGDEASQTTGLRIYQDGVMLTNVARSSADSPWSVDSSLPSPVIVTLSAEAPGNIKSCSGSYADQTGLEGSVGAGYENWEGLGPAGSATCKIDFWCGGE